VSFGRKGPRKGELGVPTFFWKRRGRLPSSTEDLAGKGRDIQENPGADLLKKGARPSTRPNIARRVG